MVDAGDVKARIALSEARAFSGQRVGLVVDFDIAPGWHVYGTPLPQDYTPTTVIFDNDLLSGQNLDLPKPTPVKFELLGETLPVYQGRFKAVGDILLRQKLTPGEHRLGGTLSFQECNDNLCKMPQRVRFEMPLWIGARGVNLDMAAEVWVGMHISISVHTGLWSGTTVLSRIVRLVHYCDGEPIFFRAICKRNMSRRSLAVLRLATLIMKRTIPKRTETAAHD